jgi:hypothetical protein
MGKRIRKLEPISIEWAALKSTFPNQSSYFSDLMFLTLSGDNSNLGQHFKNHYEL